MKKLFGAIICAALFVVAAPTTFIKANDDTTDIPVEDNQTNQNENIELEVVGATIENGVSKISNGRFDLLVKFPYDINVEDYEIKFESDNENIFRNQYGNLQSIDGKKNEAIVKDIYFENNGTVTLNVDIENGPLNSIFTRKINVENTFGELIVSETELNLHSNDLIYYTLGLENPWLTDTTNIGFLQKDGSFYLPSRTEFEIDDTSVALTGIAQKWENNPWVNSLKEWPYYDEFLPFFQEKAKLSGCEFTTFPEVSDILVEFSKKEGIPVGGWGMTSAQGNSIIARKPGTTYIKIKCAGQTKTIKVNVSNITEAPISALPSNLKNEYYSDSNKNISLNLTKTDKISKDVFEAAKETGKGSIFNIVDKNGKLNYGWSFDGKKIKNTNVDVDLSINKNTEKEKQIEETIKQKDIKVLDFAHHGELPAPATIKMNVSDQYKDGQKLYLNYWNESAKTPFTEIQKNIVVKDGYVEFTIDHCSTYFLSTDKVSIVKEEINDNTDNDKEPTKNNDKQTNNSTNNEVKNDKPQTNENVTTPNTGVEDNSILYAFLALTSLALAGVIIVRKRFVE